MLVDNEGEEFCGGVDNQVNATDGANEICHPSSEEKKADGAEKKEEIADETQGEKHPFLFGGKKRHHSGCANDEKEYSKPQTDDADGGLRKENREQTDEENTNTENDLGVSK